MLTPTQISTQPHVAPLRVPNYDFRTQVRGNAFYAMSHTSNTIQTFSYSGQPCDAKSDNND